ncbi:MAG: type II toxin-antitoxin system HicB family antitoxin [Chloroflexi bacterium]|nr:type II toxin-antitoxin system HicB family antitoxin [Chloroflexota bacterium]MCI0580543.1 type II toxin-antitoxin system HicB family antitoxin [Chloroflexota bacterium]MCI0648923.1 type II toxin-antitoxin system HicB family antitoxin [Chloroflexota bacterium]MCI0730938.1 type II toxin-antitoxin system HicB family antitoxin [Chloroflexota bacterium]
MTTTYDVYLEIGPTGLCMAHAPALPGCFVRAENREVALAMLPAAIEEYQAWLEQHGETPAGPGPFGLRVADVQEGLGPFDSGDQAALLANENQPLPRPEMETYLRYMAYNRADLLALVGDLPEEVLAWQAGEAEMSTGRILRHVGRAEKWYVTRVVDPAMLPPAWEEEEPAVFAFLEQSRQAAVARLQRLTDEERAGLFYPDAGDNEAWTARKVLRRFLEHEREHVGHVRQVLAAWRADLMARLAAERSALAWKLISLDEETLSRRPVFEGYTAKDLLAHVAAWDEFHVNRMKLAAAGREAEIASVELDDYNAAIHAERQGWSLDQALDAFMAARRSVLETSAGISDELFHRPVRLPWGDVRSVRQWTVWRYEHDAGHLADLDNWRKNEQPPRGISPNSVLQAILETGREEMLATAALIPENERETRPVCGVWTLKDVLGHVADWEWYGVEGLRPGQPSGRSLAIDYPGTIQKWNDLHAAARQDHSWKRVWADFVGARAALREILAGLSQEDLARPLPAPWDPKGIVYRWIALWLFHEREHAADLRKELCLPGWPERLTRV